MPQELFFVNKTPSSACLTRSQRDERTKILSYVQTNRRKQEVKKASRRHAAEDGTRDTDGARAGMDNTLTTRTMTFAQSDTHDDGVTTGAVAAMQGTPISTRSYPIHNSSDPFHCTVASTDVGNHLLLHCNLYSVFRRMYLGEAFAPQSVLKLSFVAGTSFQDTNSEKHHHAAIFTARLKRCVEDRALMYATLAYGSSFLAWTTGGAANKHAGFGLGSDEGDKAPSAEFFLGRALREVRTRLAKHSDFQGHGQTGQGRGHVVDPWLILAIYNLTVTEMWNGMPQLWTRFPQKHAVVAQTGRFGRHASRVHLSALLRLVGLAGGWDALGARTNLSALSGTSTGDGRSPGLESLEVALGSYLLDSAVLSDKSLRLYEYTDPMMPLDWGPGGVPPQVFASGEDNPFPRMGTAFATLDTLSTEVKITMDEIAGYCRIAHIAWTRHAESINSAMELWLFRRLQEIGVRLMILYHSFTTDATGTSSGPTLRRVNQCVCLAALVFLLSCTANVGAQTSANYQAARLRILLAQHLELGEHAGTRGGAMEMDQGLKLWCLSTGALLSVMLPARAWFVETMRKVWRECMEGPEMQGETPSEALTRALEPYLFFPERQSEVSSIL